MKNHSKAFRLAIQALFVALIAVQTMVPWLGYIPLGFLSVTIIHITVIVGAIMFGPGEGMVIGFTWGLFSLIRAYTAPSSPLDTLAFTNPLVSVVPRILIGLFAAWTFWALFKLTHRQLVASIGAAIIGTATNTVLVLGAMGLIYSGQVATFYNVSSGNLIKVLVGIVISNGIPEMIGAIILTPLLVRVLTTATHMIPWHVAALAKPAQLGTHN
ncbi:ECF transporter S component [Lacticaseibacillus mingshuiensis]|uniref:ECF transporter S component n=1 Tax=Lacticaseibacillus mingshuiensis TaxID=2799574 RepID=A0ABW4CJD4_9LACO|nr:ECF transporter S component [Lacticaseibacillus mingshuiensis]